MSKARETPRLTALRQACGLLARSACHTQDHQLALSILRNLARQTVERVRPEPAPSTQLALWLQALDGIELPWKIPADYPLPCIPLQCTLSAVECVRRQLKSERQRTTDIERGQAPDYPTCDSRRCVEGAAVRARLDPVAKVTSSEAGPNGRFERSRSQEAQYRARHRLEVVGLLDEVPTLDGLPRGVQSTGKEAD